MKQLLRSPAPLNFEGKFYWLNRLKIVAPLPSELFPGILLSVSGSSEEGLAAARETGATAIEYPKPAAQCARAPGARTWYWEFGSRSARQGEAEAWQVATERFPQDRKGFLTHQLAMMNSDSVWHKTLSTLGTESDGNKRWDNITLFKAAAGGQCKSGLLIISRIKFFVMMHALLAACYGLVRRWWDPPAWALLRTLEIEPRLPLGPIIKGAIAEFGPTKQVDVIGG
jgi:hypothetical protein